MKRYLLLFFCLKVMQLYCMDNTVVEIFVEFSAQNRAIGALVDQELQRLGLISNVDHQELGKKVRDHLRENLFWEYKLYNGPTLIVRDSEAFRR